jgi:hypothetical protein
MDCPLLCILQKLVFENQSFICQLAEVIDFDFVELRCAPVLPPFRARGIRKKSVRVFMHKSGHKYY